MAFVFCYVLNSYRSCNCYTEVGTGVSLPLRARWKLTFITACNTVSSTWECKFIPWTQNTGRYDYTLITNLMHWLLFIR